MGERREVRELGEKVVRKWGRERGRKLGCERKWGPREGCDGVRE